MAELAAKTTASPSQHITLEKDDSNDGGYAISTDKDRYVGHKYHMESGEPVFVSFRDRMFYKYNSYALSISVVRQLVEDGIETLFIIGENLTLYKYSIETFLNAETDDDHDPQFVPPVTTADYAYEAFEPAGIYPDTLEIPKRAKD